MPSNAGGGVADGDDEELFRDVLDDSWSSSNEGTGGTSAVSGASGGGVGVVVGVRAQPSQPSQASLSLSSSPTPSAGSLVPMTHGEGPCAAQTHPLSLPLSLCVCMCLCMCVYVCVCVCVCMCVCVCAALEQLGSREMHLLPPLPPLPPPSLSKSVAVALRDKQLNSTDDDLPIGNTELLRELSESFTYFSSDGGVENESGGGGDGADDLERLKADLDTVQRRSVYYICIYV